MPAPYIEVKRAVRCGRFLIVTGRAEPVVDGNVPINGVQGELLKGGATIAEGRTVVFQASMRRRGMGARVDRRSGWAVIFRRRPQDPIVRGPFDIRVDYLLGNGGTGSETHPIRRTHILEADDCRAAGAKVMLADPDYIHPTGDPYTLDMTIPESDYFVVLGTTTSLMLSATLTRGGTVIQADCLDTWLDESLWWAIFPSLNEYPSGDFILEATSIAGPAPNKTITMP